MRLKKVSFGTSRIQKLRRVSLDQNILETLGLAIGDMVRVELDLEQEAVIIRPVTESHPTQENAETPRRIRANR